jgi:hypothetical protein
VDAFRDDEDDMLWRAYARNAYDESIFDLGRRNLTGFRESLETGAYAAGGILSTAPDVAEWLPSMLFIIPPGIGLAAVTLRLGSLWPLVRYHFRAGRTRPAGRQPVVAVRSQHSRPGRTRRCDGAVAPLAGPLDLPGRPSRRRFGYQ